MAAILFVLCWLFEPDSVFSEGAPTPCSVWGCGSRRWSLAWHATIAGVALGLLATAYPPSGRCPRKKQVQSGAASGRNRRLAMRAPQVEAWRWPSLRTNAFSIGSTLDELS